jgi:hypothetical protein
LVYNVTICGYIAHQGRARKRASPGSEMDENC